MKNLICLLCFSSLILFACNDAAKTETTSKDSVTSQAPVVDPAALKMSGTYGGFVPCVDCEGIITYLSLKPDMTYSLEETYYKKDEKVFRTASTWKMENGKVDLYENGKIKLSFLPEGDKLWQLDHEGNRISGNLGDKYVLNKQEMADKSRLKQKTDAGIDFAAHGNEPFWGLDIDKGNKIIFSSPNLKDSVNVPYAEPTVTNNIREYHIESEKTKLDITVSPQFCSDGMSDFLYEYKVTVKYNNKTYSGCGSLLGTL